MLFIGMAPFAMSIDNCCHPYDHRSMIPAIAVPPLPLKSPPQTMLRIQAAEAPDNRRMNRFSISNQGQSSVVSESTDHASRRIVDDYQSLSAGQSLPRFDISPPVFAMGSCFAGEIETALLTVSPVPLGMAFSQGDVIIANARSKAMSRATAGAFCPTHSGCSYFPSYQMLRYSNPRLPGARINRMCSSKWSRPSSMRSGRRISPPRVTWTPRDVHHAPT